MTLAPGPAGLRRIRFAAEAATFAATIAVFAKAALTIAAPIPVPPPALQSPSSEAGGAFFISSSNAGGNPFRAADNSRAASSAPLTESALNIILYGTWRGTAGAAAMLSADGAPQRKVAAGEEIVAGVTLEEVQDEFVVINNNGAREAVAIVNRRVDMSAPARAGQTASEEALPSAAPLRDASLERAAAVAPTTVRAVLPAAERPADTIAAAAPDETD